MAASATSFNNNFMDSLPFCQRESITQAKGRTTVCEGETKTRKNSSPSPCPSPSPKKVTRGYRAGVFFIRLDVAMSAPP